MGVRGYQDSGSAPNRCMTHMCDMDVTTNQQNGSRPVSENFVFSTTPRLYSTIRTRVDDGVVTVRTVGAVLVDAVEHLVVVVGRIFVGRLADEHCRQIAPDHHLLLLIILVGFVIDDQQPRLVRVGLDPLDDLLVIFVAYVRSVHLHNTVALFQTGQIGWRVLVNLTDVLPRLSLLGVQVEAVAVESLPFLDVTLARPRRIVWNCRTHFRPMICRANLTILPSSTTSAPPEQKYGDYVRSRDNNK